MIQTMEVKKLKLISEEVVEKSLVKSEKETDRKEIPDLKSEKETNGKEKVK